MARLLAKTAHAYACAEEGWRGFTPFLRGIILGEAPLEIGHLVGSGIGTGAPGIDLHEIEIDRTVFGNDRLVVVKVRLFSDRESPTHYVVVGNRL